VDEAPAERERRQLPAQDAGGAVGGTHIVLVTSAPDRIWPPSARAPADSLPRASGRCAAALLSRRTRGPSAPRWRRPWRRVGRRALRAAAAEDDALWQTVTPCATPRVAVRAASCGSSTRRLGRRRQRGEAGAAGGPVAAGRLYRDALVTAAGRPSWAVPRAGEALAALGTRPLNRALAAIVEADGALAANMNALSRSERLLLELRRQESAPRRASA